MVITKIENICPVKIVGVMNLEKAMKFMLTALNISSIDIKTPIAFLRVKTPNIPMQKRIAAKAK
jgi:hypothetical protein